LPTLQQRIIRFKDHVTSGKNILFIFKGHYHHKIFQSNISYEQSIDLLNTLAEYKGDYNFKLLVVNEHPTHNETITTDNLQFYLD